MLCRENEAYFRTLMIFLYIVPFQHFFSINKKKKYSCIITLITVMQQKYLHC